MQAITSQDTIINILIIWVILQMALVLFVLITAYGVQLFLKYKARDNKKKIALLEDLLSLIATREPPALKQDEKKIFLKNFYLLVDIFCKNKTILDSSEVKNLVVTEIFQNKVPHIYKSYFFTRRYYALKCLEFNSQCYPEEIFISLIQDSTLLISVNAAMLAVKRPTQAIVDKIIEVFSKSRRVQENLFSQIVASMQPTICVYIIHKLDSIQEPYERAFCYLILQKLDNIKEIYQKAQDDLQSTVINLKISALKYCAKNDLISLDEICQYLNDPIWQVRVATLQILAKRKEPRTIPLIAKRLRDTAWWVRLNAALSLKSFGAAGIQCLQLQQPETDRYAYEIAQYVLAIKQDRKNDFNL